MNEADPPGPNACCESGSVCVFAKALLARAALCELSLRRSVGERELVDCSSVVARTNCATLAALLRERAWFALRLPGPQHPMIHAQAMKLYCGGLIGLRHALEAAQPNVHAMAGVAHERYGSLTALPWEAIVADVVAWQPHRRRSTAAP